MKKIIMTFLFLLTLSACSNTKTDITNKENNNDIGTQLATSTYLSHELLNDEEHLSLNNLHYSSTSVMLLSTIDEAVIETKMDQMMRYFDNIEMFLEKTPKTALDIKESSSTKEGYESQVSYEFEEKTYTIYYNVISETEDTDLEETEFRLEGILEYDDLSFNIIGGSEVEDDELEMYFETHQTESDDYVRVEIENDSNEQYFEIEEHIDGVENYSEVTLEKDGLDGAIEIYIEENGLDTYYEITKEVDGEETIYYFEYSIGDTTGSIEMIVTLDESNNEMRHFIIEEDDYYKEYTVGNNDEI